MVVDNPYPNSWLAGQKRLERLKEIGKQNLEKVEYEISKYFLMKEKQHRQTRAAQERREKLEKIESQIRSEVSVNVPIGKPKRAIGDLIEDKIFALEELLKLKRKKGFGKRLRGLIEVLCCIPEKDYCTLKEIFSDGRVFVHIPKIELAGSISKVGEFKDFVLYLDSELESRPYSYVRKVAGHELAHLLLHSDFSIQKKESVAEAEANLQTAIWGF